MHGHLRRRLEAVRPPWPDLAVALLLSALTLWLTLRHGQDATAATPYLGEPSGPRSRPPVQQPGGSGQDPVGVAAWSLLVTLPLAWRRRSPLIVFTVQFLASLAVAGAGTWATFLALLIGAYSLAAGGRRPLVSIGVLLAAATVAALSFSEVTPPIPGWAGAFAILTPIALFGTTIRATRARATAAAERAEALRYGQEAATRAAVA
ncbi:hypothetical protein [Acrocarpospora sp. B8E8]|uniref:DUF7134 domain-containing protein n=1 Tax=Acrocarpospora sp. B8E8 TaxID=3153572 RepID=UPI00325EB5C7